VEFNDVYDENRQRTGKLHRRGTRWNDGEYGLIVCVWVYDGRGNLLLTRRAPGKSFAGTWENSGGAAKAGENSLQAIRRELFEETGIAAEESEFELLCSDRDSHMFYDFYCLRKDVPLRSIKLLPGETDAVQWASFAQVRELIRKKKICYIIAGQFFRQEPMLKLKQIAQE